MIQCPQEARIQSYLDGELTRDERKELARHLDHCTLCTQVLHELKRLTAWSDEALSESFSPLPDEAKIDVAQAWDTFQARLHQRNQTVEPPVETSEMIQPTSSTKMKRSWFTMAKTYQKWIAGTAAAAVVISVLTIPQVQAAAGDLLSIFRVNKIESVKITQEELRSIEQLFNGNEIGEKTIAGLGTFSVDHPSEYQSFDSEASLKEAGHPLVPMPSGYKFSSASTNPEYTVHIQLDTVKANKMLTQLGAGVQFDEKLNNKRFSLTVPKTTHYYFSDDANPNTNLSYQLIGAPKLDVPADVDVEELRRTILASPLIPSGVSKQLASIKDWQSTLPIPFVEGNDQVEEVKVNGHKGLFIKNRHGYGGSLMWEQDGLIRQLEYNNYADPSTQDAKSILLDTAKLYN
ncbi:hypothetical protein CIG75_20140 [Tumebacillus algifaecis]|uniref:Anti-sigma-W factor RsiW n=1 Tax=Tumebacillus algifaecis TaxID=1214604 RepID=A0A223D5Y8_9BACL|nr:zf-HC2 domain-containing protein [Tumebacillus algifaecis]ASS76981.1 hypothetical protein CIG75_20140 [Tumebacillus algifaecis]